MCQSDSQVRFWNGLVKNVRYVVRKVDDKERHEIEPDDGVDRLKDLVYQICEVVRPRSAAYVDELWLFDSKVFLFIVGSFDSRRIYGTLVINNVVSIFNDVRNNSVGVDSGSGKI